MLIVIKVETTTMEIMNAVLAKKKITITGEAINLYPEDDYIKELEEKAQNYDDLIAFGELISESMGYVNIDENRERAKELKAKSIKLLEEFDNLLIEAKKTPKFKSFEERLTYSLNLDSSSDIKGGYLGAKVGPRTNL